MNKLFTLISLLAVLTLNTGCSFAPSTFFGATSKPEATNQVINDIQFKRSLKRLMTWEDQWALRDKIKAGAYSGKSFEKINSNFYFALMRVWKNEYSFIPVF